MMAKKKEVQDLSYEDAFEELQTVVEELETGQLALEDSLALFERGQALSARCSALLEKAQLRLTELTSGQDGVLIEGDFDVGDD
jgi:exodeoxyribonuclease VII small subunit